MSKSQFNIKISSELLKQIKMQAMRSGKSLTDHITELIEMSLRKPNLDSSDQIYLERIEKIENRLLSIENIIGNL
tara:strand:+ start:98 stop:322 length:225 start_codon:yes stop_codon:yes gene_type:complete